MDETRRFYNELAEDYTAIVADWDASVVRQGEIIDRVIRRLMGEGSPSVLDATCGIGTQAIGLALHGYQVTGTDLSPASVERGRREAARLGASVVFKVADVRDLSASVEPSYDVVISFDNALPHLIDSVDLAAGVQNLHRMLRGGGLLLVSIRDYDALLTARPGGEPPRMFGDPGSRRVVTQAWEWDPIEPVYRLHQFVLREHPGGEWSARHFTAQYRALRRTELAAMAADAGFRDIEWLEPATTGYYQPILAARATSPRPQPRF